MNFFCLTSSICLFIDFIIKLFPPTDLQDKHLSFSVTITPDTPAKQRTATCLRKQMTSYTQQSTAQPRPPRSGIRLAVWSDSCRHLRVQRSTFFFTICKLLNENKAERCFKSYLPRLITLAFPFKAMAECHCAGRRDGWKGLQESQIAALTA